MEAFSYDEFDNMTVRANGSWRYYTDTGSDYQNNRNVYTISVPGVYPNCCPPQPSYWTYNADGQVSYYLRSSMLNGKVITELNESGHAER